MKTLTVTLALLISCFTFAVASDYVEAMKAQLEAMEKIQSNTDAQEVKNGFLRIAHANMTEWLPMYYAALVQTEAALRFDVDQDAYLEEAKQYLKTIQDAGAANSEITALEGYILMGVVAVDPGARGQSLSPQVLQLFGKAIGQDRSNPRAVYLMAQMEGGMAKFFGQGPEKACGMVKMSLDLFEKEEERVDENYILPTWGHAQAKKMYEECN
ncbi:hypothetical protein [Algoriphagus namhaensis]